MRFLAAAAIYAATATVWIKNAQGWESLGVFIAALVFGAIATFSWCMAIAIAHFCCPRVEWARLAAHPILTAALFAILAVVVQSVFFGDAFEPAWRDAKAFVGLVAASALADAGLGYLLERAASSRALRSS